MADMVKVAAEIAKDEESVAVVIYQKDETPYLGADGNPATISVLGDESKAFKVAKDAATRRFMQRLGKKATPADLYQNRIEQAAAAVTGWSGWESNGEPWPCTPANAKTLFTAEHILVQVESAIQGHASFFGSASKS